MRSEDKAFQIGEVPKDHRRTAMDYERLHRAVVSAEFFVE